MTSSHSPWLVTHQAAPVESDGDDEPPSFEADASTAQVAALIAEALRGHGLQAETLSVSGDSHAEISPQHRVFNLMEGDAADPEREARFAAWMEREGITFTGNPSHALALALHKDRTRQRLAARQVPIARGLMASSPEVDLRGFAGPWFVKPAEADGSIGIDEGSVVHDEASLRERVAWLLQHFGGSCLVERYLPGTEVNVSLFPGPRGSLQAALSAVDFSACSSGARFVTYGCKWDPSSPDYAARSVPAHELVDRVTLVRAEKIGRAAFAALGCQGYARIDMRLDEAGLPFVIDVNPNPDLDPGAGLCLSASFLGISFEEIIRRVAAQAHKVHHARPPHPRRRSALPGQAAVDHRELSA